jgi:hypothetical protein
MNGPSQDSPLTYLLSPATFISVCRDVTTGLENLQTSWRLETRQEPQWRHITLQLGCVPGFIEFALLGLYARSGTY